MATPSSATSAQQQLHEKLVDVFSLLFGVHPGYRPMHAKGIVCEGTFVPAAASLSRASHFQRESVPVKRCGFRIPPPAGYSRR